MLINKTKSKAILANQEKALEKKIQSATFVIANPLPTIQLNVAKEVVTHQTFSCCSWCFSV